MARKQIPTANDFNKITDGILLIEALKLIKEKHDAIIVAIESGEDNKLTANPPMEYTIQPEDYLVLIAQARPQLGK